LVGCCGMTGFWNTVHGRRLVNAWFSHDVCNFIFLWNRIDFFSNFLFYKTSLMYYLFCSVKDLLRNRWFVRYAAAKMRFCHVFSWFCMFLVKMSGFWVCVLCNQKIFYTKNKVFLLSSILHCLDAVYVLWILRNLLFCMI
jgi:hypothetical protein